MTDRDRCLRVADECERMAKRTIDLTDRTALLDMARLWRELADTAVTAEWVEEIEARGAVATRGGRLN